jgi:hypothetical protein
LGAKLTPAGSDPDVRLTVGDGVPDAATVKVPGWPAVNVVVVLLVKLGAVPVTSTLPDVPVIDAVTVSVAVTVCSPAVAKVTPLTNVWVPAAAAVNV